MQLSRRAVIHTTSPLRPSILLDAQIRYKSIVLLWVTHMVDCTRGSAVRQAITAMQMRYIIRPPPPPHLPVPLPPSVVVPEVN